MNFENILYVLADGIARITFNRPDKLNSLTEEMHAELRSAPDAVHADPSARALVLKAAGRRFSASQDLRERAIQIQFAKMPAPANTGDATDNPFILHPPSLR